MLNDLFPFYYIYATEVLSVSIIYRTCHFECHFNTITAVCDVCHACMEKTIYTQFGAPLCVVMISRTNLSLTTAYNDKHYISVFFIY